MLSQILTKILHDMLYGVGVANERRKILNKIKKMTGSKKVWQIFWLFAGIGMLGFGVLRGEAGIVLTKAIKLCLECVVIG